MRRRDFGVIIPEGTATRPSFSVRWWDGPRQRRKRGFSTKGAAAEFLARKRIELADRPPEPGEPPPPEITVREAFNAYEEHLTEKGNKERSIKTTMHRLRAFFTADTMPLSMLTPKACAGTYAALRTASAVDSPLKPHGRVVACRTGRTDRTNPTDKDPSSARDVAHHRAGSVASRQVLRASPAPGANSVDAALNRMGSSGLGTRLQSRDVQELEDLRRHEAMVAQGRAKLRQGVQGARRAH